MWGKTEVYLACEGGKASAMEWTPTSLGFLCNFVSTVKATPIDIKIDKKNPKKTNLYYTGITLL